MSALTYRILIHILALCVFAAYLINLRRQLKLGTPLTELKTVILGLIISGIPMIYTLATIILTLMPRGF